MKRIVAGVALSLSMKSWASAQNRSLKTLPELASYTGADREQILYEGAKSEGRVVWYTSLSGGSYKALATASKRNIRVSLSEFTARRDRNWRYE